MVTQTNTSTIIALKKELCNLLEKNHYNLLSEEVLYLSRQLDALLLPVFERQLYFYRNINCSTKKLIQ